MSRRVIEDHKVINIWKCPCGKTADINPTFYEFHNTPVCDCDCDMVYSHTEIEE